MGARTLQALLETERELAEERASALARIGRRLESLLNSLDDLGQRCGSGSGSERARARRRYRELHAEARRYRWYLEVQREAVGLRSHQVLDRVVPLPSPSPPTSPR